MIAARDPPQCRRGGFPSCTFVPFVVSALRAAGQRETAANSLASYVGVVLLE